MPPWVFLPGGAALALFCGLTGGALAIVAVVRRGERGLLAYGAIVPLVLVTVIRAFRERWDAHRKIAKVTLPLWGYVSVTGVVIYWMLYRL